MGARRHQIPQFFVLKFDYRSGRMSVKPRFPVGLGPQSGKQLTARLERQKAVMIDHCDGSRPADWMWGLYFTVVSDRLRLALTARFPKCVEFRRLRIGSDLKHRVEGPLWWFRAKVNAGPESETQGHSVWVGKRYMRPPPEYGVVFDHTTWRGNPLFSLECPVDRHTYCTEESLDFFAEFSGVCAFRVEEYGMPNTCVLCPRRTKGVRPIRCST